MTAGLPPSCWIRIGTPIAAAITGNAAKALPMIIVNTTMPKAIQHHREEDATVRE